MSKLYTSGPRVKNVKIIHYWLKGYKCQHYAQVVPRVKNVKIIHYWLKGYKCQHYTQVVQELKMSKLYTIG